MKKWLHSLFYVPKYGKVSEKTLYARLGLHIGVIILCMMGICLTAFAFFASSVTSGSNTLVGAYFDVSITVLDPNGEAVLEGSGQREYAMEMKADTVYTVKVSANGNAQTGFMILKIGDNSYHTQQLGKVGQTTATIQFDIQLTETHLVTFLPHWGTSSYFPAAGDSLAFYLKNDQVHTISIPSASEPSSPSEEP